MRFKVILWVFGLPFGLVDLDEFEFYCLWIFSWLLLLYSFCLEQSSLWPHFIDCVFLCYHFYHNECNSLLCSTKELCFQQSNCWIGIASYLLTLVTGSALLKIEKNISPVIETVIFLRQASFKLQWGCNGQHKHDIVSFERRNITTEERSSKQVYFSPKFVSSFAFIMWERLCLCYSCCLFRNFTSQHEKDWYYL